MNPFCMHLSNIHNMKTNFKIKIKECIKWFLSPGNFSNNEQSKLFQSNGFFVMLNEDISVNIEAFLHIQNNQWSCYICCDGGCQCLILDFGRVEMLVT